MKYLVQHSLQAIANLRYAYLSSVALQSYGKVLTLVDDVHGEQFHQFALCYFLQTFSFVMFRELLTLMTSDNVFTLERQYLRSSNFKLCVIFFSSFSSSSSRCSFSEIHARVINESRSCNRFIPVSHDTSYSEFCPKRYCSPKSFRIPAFLFTKLMCHRLDLVY